MAMRLARARRHALNIPGPSCTAIAQFVKLGALMSYGPDLADLVRRAAGYVARILRGEYPGVLPYYQPTTFDLTINLRTAKALGLIVPPALLASAVEVID